MIVLSPSWRKSDVFGYRFVGTLKRDGVEVWRCAHGHHYTRSLAKSCAISSAWLVARILENQESAGIRHAERIIQGLERDGLLKVVGPFTQEEA